MFGWFKKKRIDKSNRRIGTLKLTGEESGLFCSPFPVEIYCIVEEIANFKWNVSLSFN